MHLNLFPMPESAPAAPKYAAKKTQNRPALRDLDLKSGITVDLDHNATNGIAASGRIFGGAR
jgi:hypothetical protein